MSTRKVSSAKSNPAPKPSSPSINPSPRAGSSSHASKPPDPERFARKAPKIMTNLMKDFDINHVQAAAIVGNLGHETGGFRNLHELGQPPGQGGYGWAQWDDRGPEFLAWSKEKGLNWKSDQANYGFLKHELKTTEKRTITALSKTTKLTDAVRVFEQNYERAGVKNYPSRNNFAREALDAYNRKRK